MAKTYYVNINSITTTDGVVCSSPKITFEKPTCANIVCEVLKDAQGNPIKIKVQVPEDCPDGCVYVKIDCKEQCSTCGEQRLKICPCTTDADCPDCHTCGPNGYCVSLCNENEFCSGDNCVECDDFHPCTGGKVCNGGKCECPPDKPYQNQKGECVQCNSSTPLSACQLCIDGFIVVKNCEAGVLNPDTCDCVECVKSSDCTKPNQKCGPNGCECEDGFRLNVTTGDCEPIDDCTRDEDCGPCKKCLPNRKCGDYTCPDGYIPSNIPGKCCVKVCDCNNPSCPPGHVCVNLDGVNCICQDCNVKCQSGKCPDGCYCKDGIDCGTNPCSGKCGPGQPCAPGCGCNENNDCVPCSSLNCTKCAQTPGCECTTPDNCTESPCQGPCDQNNPCPGTNCGCTEEKLCINCGQVNCSNDDDCPMGCNCQEGGKCGKTPCANVFCSTPEECGKDCDCIEGSCKPGTPNPKDGCEDTFEMEENGCTLKATETTKNCCECRDVYLHAALTAGATSRTVDSKLRVGPNITDAALSATGIIGDEAISGQVRYTWEQTAKEVNGAGIVIVGGAEITLSTNVITTFSNSDSSTINATVKANGQTFVQAGKTYKITETVMYAESVGLLVNTINKCTYQLGRSILYRKSASESGNYSVLIAKVQRCKNPVFTWYKSNDGSTWTQIKKVYSQESSEDVFFDVLTKTDGLELCKYFKVRTDCGCVQETVFSCNNSSATKYEPKMPDALDIEQLNTCGTQIKIKEITLCDLYGPTTPPFKLYINGVFHSNITPNASHKIFVGDLTITNTLPITEVKLEYPCDSCNEPLIVVLPATGGDCFECTDADLTIDTITGTCYVATWHVIGTMHEVLVPANPVVGCKVDIYFDDVYVGYAYTDSNGDYDASVNVPTELRRNKTYTVKAVNCKGCSITSSHVVSDCCAFTIGNAYYDCSTNSVISTPNGCDAPNATTFATISYDDNSHVDIVGLTYSNNMALPYPLPNGSYTMFVKCDNGCGFDAHFTVGCTPPDFALSSSCDGLQGKITASGFTGGTGGPYELEYVSNAGSVFSMADPTTWNSTPGTTYTVRLKDSAGNVSPDKTIVGPDCSANQFSFTGLMKCIMGIQKFCFTPSQTGYYTALVKDFNNVTVYSGSLYATANQELCTNFSTPPANGVGTIQLTYNGNTQSVNMNVVTCAVASIAYDCSTGLSVSGVASFNVHSVGFPPAGYGPFAPGDPSLFFTDGVNDTRTLTIKSPDGTETYGTVQTNCCTHDFTPQDDVCSGTNAKVKISLTGAAGNYEVRISNGITPVCLPQAIAHAGGTVIYALTCNLASSTSYSIEVVNVDYGNRVYKDQAIGNTTCSVTKGYSSTNCGLTGGTGGGVGCGVVESDIVITGGCSPLVTNNSAFVVNVQFHSTENTNCTGGSFNIGSPQTINPGQTINYGALGNPNLGKKLFVTYNAISGDPCVLTICYAGCTGSSSCTLTDDPSPACSTLGAAPGNRRLTTTNLNATGVFLYIDGVSKGLIAPGGSNISYYPNNTNHTILFKCVDDINEQRTINYLLNC